MRFPIVLHTDDGVRYGVTVPDLPGCFSSGDSLDLALESVREAIDLHLEGLTEDGGEIPAVQSLATHKANPEYADGTWALVDVDVSRYDGKAEKINITVPRRVLVRIDDFVAAHRANRSAFLVEAAEEAMRKMRVGGTLFAEETGRTSYGEIKRSAASGRLLLQKPSTRSGVEPGWAPRGAKALPQQGARPAAAAAAHGKPVAKAAKARPKAKSE